MHTVGVGPDNSNYTRLLWINSHSIIGLRDKQIDVLLLNSTSNQFQVKGQIDYYIYRQNWTTYFSTATEFTRLESLDFALNSQVDPSRLILYGLSDVVGSNLNDLGVLMRQRLLLVLIISLPSYQLLSAGSIPIAFDKTDLSTRPWGYFGFKPLQNWTKNLMYELYFHFITSFSRTKLCYEMWFSKITYDEEVPHSYIAGWYTTSLNLQLPHAEILTVESYPSKTNIYKLRYLANSAGKGLVHEYDFDSQAPSVTLSFNQILPLLNSAGKLSAFNCSRVWEQCVFVLDTNKVLQASYNFDTRAQTWLIGKLESPSKTGNSVLVPVPDRIHEVRFFGRLLALVSYSPGSKILVYTNHALDTPYTILQEQYMSQVVLSFASDCPEDTQHTDCHEYIIQAQNSSSAAVYSLSEMEIKLTNYSVSQLSKGVEFKLSFNDPALLEVKLPANLHKNISFRFMLESPVSGWSATPTTNYSDVLIVMAAVVVMIMVGFVLNYVHYQLTTGNDAYKEPDLPVTDYANHKRQQDTPHD